MEAVSRKTRLRQLQVLENFSPVAALSTWESFSLEEEAKIARILNRLAEKFAQVSAPDLVFNERFYSALQFYRNSRFELETETYFRSPCHVPSITSSIPYPLSRGNVCDIVFENSFEPVYELFRKEYEGKEEHKKVYARVWKHPEGKSLGTLFAIHGWMMGDSRLSAVTLVPGFFFKLGLNVIVYELPYHGRRACPGEEFFPCSDLARTNEGFAQTISELRSLALWVKEQDDKPIGAIGLSLGGYIAALWASLDPLDFVICAAPLVSMAEIASSLVRKLQRKGRKGGELPRVNEQELRRAFAVHCPLSYAPRVPLEKRLILAGLADNVIPSTQPEALWRHWSKPRMHWLSAGHYGQVVEGATLKHMHDFLARNGLAYSRLLDIRNDNC